uniref:BspA family leucine-rich repeat surface protein n=1 Tax=uncultured Methanobrevibacter sp. TaxID=253161 RepID=UPI00261058A9
NMSYMFYGCNSLISLPDISKWNVKNVNNMSYMFYGCNSLISLPDIYKWNVENVNNMSYMFYGCISLVSFLNIQLSNISNTFDRNNIFYDYFNFLNNIENPVNNFIKIEKQNTLLNKYALKGQKILIVMLWSKILISNENYFIHKDYLCKASPESEFCLKDISDYLGIIIDIVENYRNAIEKITTKDKNGKCPYYSVWVINGPPYEDLPDGTKEGFLFGQFLEVLKLFWEKGGALIFLAGGWKCQYQTNEFLKMLDINGKKVEFYLVGDDDEKGTICHQGGKLLNGDETGLLKDKSLFSKKNEKCLGIERLSIGHNLINLFV